ncbi:MAG: hypothetical protein A2014_03560 [Spirochaetes bacterium GWF1_49_6]|nr:MAG: hypothetical protein A2014_03560 [Spirochaetes bacterium GWF1_49_6]
MKEKIIRGLIILAVGFGALFLIRMIYAFAVGAKSSSSQGYYQTPPGYSDNTMMLNNNVITGEIQSSSGSLYRYGNFMSETTVKYMNDKGGAPQPVAIEQKYEMVGNISLRSSRFEKDETDIRGLIASNNAVIQNESRNGLPGNRILQLVIGVPPEHFDSIIKELQKFGTVKSLSINKYDKTGEYQDLNVQKQSLETMRDSLIALKKKPGTINELIELEKQILEIEKTIRGLGVSLGGFSKENEFCTVELTVSEGSGALSYIFSVIVLSLEWTFWTYLAILGFGALALIVVFVVIKIMEKAGILFKSAPKQTAKKKRAKA